VVNLCYNRLPRLRKEFAALSIEEEPGEDSPIVLGALGGTGNSHQDPVRQVEAGERRSFLEEQVKNLPRSQRILIFLRFHQDCSYEEIAEIMGMPLGTVKTGLHRARQQLKTALKAGEETYV
jgi:RNA polymerase sigma factor (sigma-70 family)